MTQHQRSLLRVSVDERSVLRVTRMPREFKSRGGNSSAMAHGKQRVFYVKFLMHKLQNKNIFSMRSKAKSKSESEKPVKMNFLYIVEGCVGGFW